MVSSFEIYIEAKGDSLLTIDAFQEMIDLHNVIFSEVVYNRTASLTDEGEIVLPAGPVHYYDYC